MLEPKPFLDGEYVVNNGFTYDSYRKVAARFYLNLEFREDSVIATYRTLNGYFLVRNKKTVQGIGASQDEAIVSVNEELAKISLTIGDNLLKELNLA